MLSTSEFQEDNGTHDNSSVINNDIIKLPQEHFSSLPRTSGFLTCMACNSILARNRQLNLASMQEHYSGAASCFERIETLFLSSDNKSKR